MKRKGKRFLVLWALAAVLSVLAYRSFPPREITGFEVTFADVGQGDCVLLESEDGKVVLVDGGEKEMYDEKLGPMLGERGIKKIDLVVATHYHSDHVGAMAEVFEDFEVERLAIPDYEPKNTAKKKLLKMAKAEGAEVLELSAGDEIGDLCEGLEVLVLHPSPGGFSDDENDNSLVLSVRCFDTKLLLTGDIENAAEREIAKGYEIETDILKVAHHGSHTSSCKEFLQAADPTFAVIQCGEGNSYGHPHFETLAAFEDDDVRVFRTDADGSITFSIDEDGIGKILTTK